MFSYNGGNRLESKTTRMYGMFRRVRQVAAPWAKSAVSDFILLKGKNIRAFIKNHRNRWRHLTDLREKLRWPIRFAPPGYVEFEGSAIITKRSVLTYILVPQQIRFSIYCICLLYQSVDLRASSAPVKWGGDCDYRVVILLLNQLYSFVTIVTVVHCATEYKLRCYLITDPPNGPVLFCSLASVVCRRRLSASSVVAVCRRL